MKQLRTQLWILLAAVMLSTGCIGIKLDARSGTPVALVQNEAQADTTIKSENWDSVTATALPAGWTGANVGGNIFLTVTNVSPTSAPNAVGWFPSGATAASGPAFLTYNTADTNAGAVRLSSNLEWNSSGNGYTAVSYIFCDATIASGTLNLAGSGTTDSAYVGQVTWSSRVVTLSKWVSGTQTVTFGSITLPAGTLPSNAGSGNWFRFFVQADASHVVSLKVQKNSDTTWLNSSGAWVSAGSTYAAAPTLMSGTDSTSPLGAGKAGIGAYQSNSNGSDYEAFDDTLFEALSVSAATLGTITGPTSGAANTASGNFAFTPNGTYTGTITLSDNGAGGSFTPATLTYSGASTAQTFTYTPASGRVAAVSISATATGLSINSVSYGITHTARSFYVDSVLGSDSNAGTLASPLLSLAALVNLPAVAGDTILLKGGQSYSGSLALTMPGTLTAPDTISSYGSGQATINCGDGSGITLTDSSYTTVSNLVIAGSGVALNGTTTQATTSAGIDFVSTQPYTGTWAYGDAIDNCTVHDVYNGISIHNTATYNATAGQHPKGFNGFRLTNTTVYNCLRWGIKTFGLIKPGQTPTANDSWGVNDISQNFYIGGCLIYNVYGTHAWTNGPSGDGMLLTSLSNALIEHCVAHDCGQRNNDTTVFVGPVGIWAAECNNITFQFCEAYKISHGDTVVVVDGAAFDLDGDVTNSCYQYCYAHDCDGPGFEWGSIPGLAPTTSNNVFRFNVSHNNSTRTANGETNTFGVPTNILVYNNTFIGRQNTTSNYLGVVQNPFGGTSFVGNIVISTTAGLPQYYGLGGASAYLGGNLYWNTADSSLKITAGGTTYMSMSTLRAAGYETSILNSSAGVPLGLLANPMLRDMASGAANNIGYLTGFPTWGSLAYEPLVGSPIIGAGADIGALLSGEKPGPIDFEGRLRLQNKRPCIGAIEYPLSGVYAPTPTTTAHIIGG